jgi:hypothetical protein
MNNRESLVVRIVSLTMAVTKEGSYFCCAGGKIPSLFITTYEKHEGQNN